MNKTTHRIGWLIAAGLLAAALVAPSAAFAIDGSNEKEGGIAWNDPGFQGTGDDCKDAGLEPGEVLWHFVQTSVADEVASGNLWVTVTAAPDELGPIASYKKSGGVLHWAVISGETTLLEWRSDVAGTGNLNLSHICYGGPEEESESPSDEVESESPSAEIESRAPLPRSSRKAPLPRSSRKAPLTPSSPRSRPGPSRKSPASRPGPSRKSAGRPRRRTRLLRPPTPSVPATPLREAACR